MQREIKFRGYDKDLKQWHYGNYYFYTDTIYCVASDKEHEENEHHCILFDGFCDWNMPRPHYKAIVDGKSIGQYTGLKDKNGKEIYEGDIIEYGGQQYLEIYRASIKYKDDRFIADWIDGVMFRKDIHFWTSERKVQVIGNIHDNPELTEVAHE